MNEVQVDDIITGVGEVLSSRSLAMEVIFRKLISRIFEANHTLGAISLVPVDGEVDTPMFSNGCSVFLSYHNFTEDERGEFDSYIWNDERFSTASDSTLYDVMSYFLADLESWYPSSVPVMFREPGGFTTKEVNL